MDQLPIEVTTAVINFLPNWVDKLAIRQLSSKFDRLLFSNPIQGGQLVMEQGPVRYFVCLENVIFQTSFSFGLRVHYSLLGRTKVSEVFGYRYIEIRKINQGEKEDFSSGLKDLHFQRIQRIKEEKVNGQINEEVEDKTIIYCSHKNFRRVVGIYMRLLVSYLSFDHLKLVRTTGASSLNYFQVDLGGRFLARLRATFLRVHPDRHEKHEMALHLYTRNCQISREERNLLAFFNLLALETES